VHVIDGALKELPRPGRFVLPLLESRRESPTVMTFRFSTEAVSFRYLSNQAVRVALPGVDDPWGAARSFSLSSSPSEEGFIAVTCKISSTPFKQALSRLRPGDPAEVIGPLGAFLLDSHRPGIFLAGGIGITPFRGMYRYTVDTGDDQERRLLYSARVPEELIFRSELDEIARTSSRCRVEYSVTRSDPSRSGWTGRVGRINERWIREAAETLDRPKFYVAGLPDMVREMVTLLSGPLGVPENDIDYEVFRGF
jgi:glycine betaine catabolism B